jgi:N6-adenosine-specific RNA methylase IME4
MDLKAQLADEHAHPPLYLPLPGGSASDVYTATGPNRFDVILITPNGSWEETAALPIRSLSADPGFVFLWVGRGDQEGLERGRECLAKWGFRRAEDILWVKTSGRDGLREGEEGQAEEGMGGGGLFASQKEHCLMGIRGTVRRSTDTRFVHCNVDTDVMIWENKSEFDDCP